MFSVRQLGALEENVGPSPSTSQASTHGQTFQYLDERGHQRTRAVRDHCQAEKFSIVEHYLENGKTRRENLGCEAFEIILEKIDRIDRALIWPSSKLRLNHRPHFGQCVVHRDVLVYIDATSASDYFLGLHE